VRDGVTSGKKGWAIKIGKEALGGTSSAEMGNGGTGSRGTSKRCTGETRKRSDVWLSLLGYSKTNTGQKEKVWRADWRIHRVVGRGEVGSKGENGTAG